MPKKTRIRLLVLAAGTVVAVLAGEFGYRLLRRDRAPVGMYFRDAEREPVGLEPNPDRELTFRIRIQAAWPDPSLPAGAGVVTVPAPGAVSDWFGEGYAMPRPGVFKNVTWRPGAHFYICYQGPRRDYFDADGCVEYRFNRFGIRDRENLTLDKPKGWRRVVCLGDSFTLGWGVRQEHNWPVLIERELQRLDAHIQVINCGGAGSAYADEYELALRHRFGRFAPDLVLVTLCLNDLLVTNGKLCHYRTGALREADLPPGEHRWWMASKLLFDLSRALAAASALALDPHRDWVQELLDLPADHVWYKNKDETPAIYWRAGAPQAALRAIAAYCREHGCRTAVVVWPFLQSLEDGAFYPFERLHRLVGEFCAREGIPFLDLLPVLRGQRTEDLWVSPYDMHPNERAQLLVAPRLAAFVADQLGLG